MDHGSEDKYPKFDKRVFAGELCSKNLMRIGELATLMEKKTIRKKYPSLLLVGRRMMDIASKIKA